MHCNLPTIHASQEVVLPSQIGHYQIIKKIGKGGFAVVVLALDLKTQQKVAIKIIQRKLMDTNENMKYLESELRLHSELDHPNIVKIFDVLYEEEFIAIIMEYCSNGDMFEHIQCHTMFTFTEQLEIANQLIDALNYMHKKGIYHRDIKPENILFDSNFRPKIIDFGMSVEEDFCGHSIVGTPIYMAPETFTNQCYDVKKIDIWSLGVTLHMLSAYAYPWNTCSPAQYIKNAKQGLVEVIVAAPGVMGDLIKMMLVPDPKERASYEELIVFLNNTRQHQISKQKCNIPKISASQKFSFKKKLDISTENLLFRARKTARTRMSKILPSLNNQIYLH
ncbi:CAMK family protein kinase [Trichomonas vaginalis G3]|uniref:CAMK family protein kinase n=1 Tax=Trichomonas vaginalis (strain ATCC PRA-98 / G3) TaxID=412133 RepID=A2EJX1_TRIV3|nr:protein serine/threonine kinase protein [Trichomonas vaginalis G3]EAY07039.1 CAMK family protein kinase [Trichomonas vaginalis G3]KAI5529565.1 protein serine/threonine kinase protein [Trichomonas vaginalis G3]|eukprot:XP_001319262.1 CAMK family protein kinase [Trichomonas vaginalis G3]